MKIFIFVVMILFSGCATNTDNLARDLVYILR